MALDSFTEHDQFLRRVRFPDHVKDGVVFFRAFKDNDPRLSFTFRDEVLSTPDGLDAYHGYYSERVGVRLPAILWFSHAGLATRIAPPLPPRREPDGTDEVYGHLHCTTDKPNDNAHMKLLAKLANEGTYAGIAKQY